MQALEGLLVFRCYTAHTADILYSPLLVSTAQKSRALSCLSAHSDSPWQLVNKRLYQGLLGVLRARVLVNSNLICYRSSPLLSQTKRMHCYYKLEDQHKPSPLAILLFVCSVSINIQIMSLPKAKISFFK